MADNPLSTFLPDRAATGFFPQMKPRRRFQDREGSANVPIDVLRGRLAGMLGTPTDLANLLKSPMPTEMFGETNYEPAQQLPYGSEYFLKNLPLAPTSRVGEVAGQAGSFVPLNPMPAARAAAAGVKALGPTAGRMAEQYLTRTGGILPLDVYHGTPHRFPPTETNPLGEFDASKIGTGEGAQAYGHGLYLAESKGVGSSYRDALAPNAKMDPQTIAELQKKFDGAQAAYNAWIKANPQKFNAMKLSELQALPEAQAVGSAQDALNNATTWAKRPELSNLYKVDLPDKQISKMLDFDKPISEQPFALQQNLFNSMINAGYTKEMVNHILNTKTGSEVINDLAGRLPVRTPGPASGQEMASEFLRKAGIPGIKYLDQGSRNTSAGELIGVAKGADGWKAKIRKTPSGQVGDVIPMAPSITTSKSYPTEQAARDWANSQIGGGTRNFVVFPGEEKSLTILERNGQPGQNSLKSFIK